MDQSGGIATGPRDVLGVRSGSDIGVSICKPLKNLNGKICQICGDTVGLTATGDVFVACQECSFPLCHRCYECECENGNQSCPQCKTRYNSHKDSSHLEVDEDDYEDDDDVDDIENEVNYGEGNINKAGMQWEEDADLSSSSGHDSRMPNSNLHITNGQPVINNLVILIFPPFSHDPGLESDEEVRRVPEIGGESAGPSASRPGAGPTGGQERGQGTGDGQRKRGRSLADKENKRLKRLLRNRVSAQQARERKKAYLIDLETRVKDLEKKNSELKERLSTLQNENQMLRQILKNTTASRRGSNSGTNAE
ncbi:hypothetical protein Ahy_A10g049421 isoform D [Arachis hypogaea]|uniref:Transcription factor HY5 n=1 Tax=Arachis hypogaea TaxID=3818 RepID=A0A445B744_ARAHY|nr:hypothetical protein Ahy_A10g049421 isoform D [Arachis hypogaea]